MQGYYHTSWRGSPDSYRDDRGHPQPIECEGGYVSCYYTRILYRGIACLPAGRLRPAYSGTRNDGTRIPTDSQWRWLAF